MRHNRANDPGNKDGAVDKNTKSASYHTHHRQWFSGSGLRRPVDLIQRDHAGHDSFRCPPLDGWLSYSTDRTV